MGSTFSNNLVSALRPQPVGPGGPMRWTAFPSVLQCFASNHRCWPECVTTRATLSRAYITYNNAQRRDSIMLNQINANTFGFVLLLFFDPPLSISGLTQRPKKNTNHNNVRNVSGPNNRVDLHIIPALHVVREGCFKSVRKFGAGVKPQELLERPVRILKGTLE